MSHNMSHKSRPSFDKHGYTDKNVERPPVLAKI